jgi:hypothetical protein
VGLTLMPWVPPSVKSSAEIRRMQLAVMDGQLPRYVVCDMAKQREGQQVASALWEIVTHELGDGQGDVGVMIPADFDHAERKVKMALDDEISDRLRKLTETGDKRTKRPTGDEDNARMKRLTGSEELAQAKAMLADALATVVPPGKDALHHVSIAQLVRAAALPDGARADTEGVMLKRRFERWVMTSDGSAKVRIKTGNQGRMSVYRQFVCK